MSKYIKQDDIFELVRTGRLVSNSNFESVCKHIGCLPTIEVNEDCISEFRDYQIEWLTGHCDIELEPVLEDLIVRFLKDTAEIFIKENAPSVIPKTQIETQNSNENSNVISVVDSEDCIRREWLFKNYQTVCATVTCSKCPFDDDGGSYCRLADFVMDAPSVAPSRAEGEWIRDRY